MYKLSTILALSLSAYVLNGCGGSGSSSGGGGSTSEYPDGSSNNYNITLTKGYEVIPLGSGEYHIDIQTDYTTDLYLVLTNTDSSHTQNIRIDHNARYIQKEKKQTKITHNLVYNQVPDFISQFNNHITLNTSHKTNKQQHKSISKSHKSIGDSHTFTVEDTNGYTDYTDATLKSKVTVNTKYGYKTLLVWVSDDSFEGSCHKSKCITQNMVDGLQRHFLQNGSDNDIYDWDSSIYGEEWSHKAHDRHPNELIDQSDEINILLTDIDNDNQSNGGIMGYFYAQDNFYTSVYPNSNEMIMFYIDSVMFANDEGNGFWQREIYATLAHEFQHMIHFYQKVVLQDVSDDTWINEMLSETTEDLVATKIEHIGPRGVDPLDGSAGDYNNRYGRYPLFNKSNDISLSSWNNSLENYSNVNAFGTFLTRNYGGAKVLHNILHNNKEHEDAIEYATGEKFGTLLQKWGEAVILSSIENPYDLPTYNFGDFKYDSYNGTSYKLGSIDFFRYTYTPKLYDINDGESIRVQPHSNKYYIIGKDLYGPIDLTLSLPANTKAVLISK